MMTTSQQKISEHRFLAFMNTTSWEPLQGTTTLLRVREEIAKGSVYVPEGSGLRDEQFVITEDEIQVVDLIIVRTRCYSPMFRIIQLTRYGRTIWMMASTRSIYMDTGHICAPGLLILFEFY